MLIPITGTEVPLTFTTIEPTFSSCTYLSTTYSTTGTFTIMLGYNSLSTNINLVSYQVLIRLTLEIIPVTSGSLITYNNVFNVTLNVDVTFNETTVTNLISDNNYTISDSVITIVRDYYTDVETQFLGGLSGSFLINISNASGPNQYYVGSRTVEFYLLSSINNTL